MGVLPLQFAEGVTRETLKLTGDETFTIHGVASLRPRQDVEVTLARPDGTTETTCCASSPHNAREDYRFLEGRAATPSLLLLGGKRMSDDYVYDEATGEWVPAGEASAPTAVPAGDGVEVRDAVGNLLADGDSVTLIKDLKVKGTSQTLKRGTVVKSIRLTGDEQEIDCRFDGIKGLVLRAEFVRKR
ncbi:hypothetical protein LTR94_028763 [Friedmanniomyces endolithicus]|nr:hypothetical protein LTR94_028763 [Friedmanniomyces endolithicus]